MECFGVQVYKVQAIHKIRTNAAIKNRGNASGTMRGAMIHDCRPNCKYTQNGRKREDLIFKPGLRTISFH